VRLALPHGSLEFRDGEPVLMGILNVGLDSVADSTVMPDVDARVARGMQMVADGAGIVDVGAISGRTDTPAISEPAETELLVPVVRELSRAGVIVSVDTWRPAVVEAVLAAGAAIINDISGLADPAVARLAAGAGAGLVVMHTGAPPKERFFPHYEDPVRAVRDFLAAKLERAVAEGVLPEQLIIDPGLDYTKTPAETIDVLRQFGHLRALGRPLLLAVSRKYFIGRITGRAPEDRLAGTLAAVRYGVAHGGGIVRVHDVRATADFLAVQAALTSSEPVGLRGEDDDESLMWIRPKRAG
jgi:dihydropteroate synthase